MRGASAGGLLGVPAGDAVDRPEEGQAAAPAPTALLAALPSEIIDGAAVAKAGAEATALAATTATAGQQLQGRTHTATRPVGR